MEKSMKQQKPTGEKSILKKLETRLKLVVIGDGCVGKTSLLYAHGANTFLENHEPTVFENYVVNVVVNNKKLVEMSLWDTAGQDDYDRLRPLSYSEADVILICFSVCDTTSFLNVADKWVPEIRHYCPRTPYILVATKVDLRYQNWNKGNPIIQMKEGLTMSTRVKADTYLECSSKTLEGVKGVFQTAANLAYKFHKKSSHSCVLQ